MAFVKGLKCRECGREYPGEPLNVCDFCFGPLEVIYDYVTISEVVTHKRITDGPISIWRYQDLLPASADDPVDIMAGYTPLLKAREPGQEAGPQQPVHQERQREPVVLVQGPGGVGSRDEGG